MVLLEQFLSYILFKINDILVNTFIISWYSKAATSLSFGSAIYIVQLVPESDSGI